jgi:hypothetical protein
MNEKKDTRHSYTQTKPEFHNCVEIQRICEMTELSLLGPDRNMLAVPSNGSCVTWSMGKSGVGAQCHPGTATIF